ncbi:hypothetical protein [Ureaplasma ceti]|uniref:Asp23/Gls24 family envelope stress response protein n=1 Tax=Ureaplasma ceti TaxID=3119530 RepID=A0ABP9U6T9_9BACT
MKATRFNNSIIINLITTTANTVPGVSKVEVNEEGIDLESNVITVEAWLSDNVLNVKSAAQDLQKTIYYNLSQQLDNLDLSINIQIHI